MRKEAFRAWLPKQRKRRTGDSRKEYSPSDRKKKHELSQKNEEVVADIYFLPLSPTQPPLKAEDSQHQMVEVHLEPSAKGSPLGHVTNTGLEPKLLL